MPSWHLPHSSTGVRAGPRSRMGKGGMVPSSQMPEGPLAQGVTGSGWRVCLWAPSGQHPGLHTGVPGSV